MLLVWLRLLVRGSELDKLMVLGVVEGEEEEEAVDDADEEVVDEDAEAIVEALMHASDPKLK